MDQGNITIQYPWTTVQKHGDHNQVAHGRGSRARGRVGNLHQAVREHYQSARENGGGLNPSQLASLSTTAKRMIDEALSESIVERDDHSMNQPSKRAIYENGRTMNYIGHNGRAGVGNVVKTEDGAYYANNLGTVVQVEPTTKPVALLPSQRRVFDLDRVPFLKQAKTHDDLL